MVRLVSLVVPAAVGGTIMSLLVGAIETLRFKVMLEVEMDTMLRLGPAVVVEEPVLLVHPVR